MWEKRVIRLFGLINHSHHPVSGVASIVWDWLMHVLKLRIRIMASLNFRIEKDFKDCLFSCYSKWHPLIHSIIATWNIFEMQHLRSHVGHTLLKCTFLQDSQVGPIHTKVCETLARFVLVLFSFKLQIWYVYIFIRDSKKCSSNQWTRLKTEVFNVALKNCPKPSSKSVIKSASCSEIQIQPIKN